MAWPKWKPFSKQPNEEGGMYYKLKMWLCVCVYDYQTNYEKRIKMKIKGKSKEIRSRWEWLDTRLFYTIVSCVLIYKSTIDSGYLSSNPHSIYASKHTHTHDIAAAGIYCFFLFLHIRHTGQFHIQSIDIERMKHDFWCH